MRLIRLTPQAFDSAVAQTRLGEQARAMARAVLVDGRSQVDVGTEHGMSKQRVGLAARTVARAYQTATVPGTSAIRVELDLPEALVLELGSFVDGMRVCSDEGKVDEALKVVQEAIRKASKLLVEAL